MRLGDQLAARELYAKAAEAEERALEDIDLSKPRTFGIIAISAVALRHKAMQGNEASILAHRCLGSNRLPNFARVQLDELLDTIRRNAAGFDLSEAQLLVSLSGGSLVPGGAPMDLIASKSQKMGALLYRTVEYLKHLPHRTRGEPQKDIRDSFKPWIFQAAPGSYQFAVSVQHARQLSMFDDFDILPKDIVTRLYAILQACSESPESRLIQIVPDISYRTTFLKLTRDMAPTGNQFGRLDIRIGDVTNSLVLVPSTRNAINDAIRAIPSGSPEGADDEIRGVLRALHLDRDWIEVVDEDNNSQRIERVGEELDDRLGPMVNGPVIVHITRVGNKQYLRDIEIDE